MRCPPDSCYRELFKRYQANPILTLRYLPCPINSVCNPGATMVNGRFLLLVRIEGRRGISHLCAARSANGVTGWEIDRLPAFWPQPEHRTNMFRDLNGSRLSRSNCVGDLNGNSTIELWDLFHKICTSGSALRQTGPRSI